MDVLVSVIGAIALSLPSIAHHIGAYGRRTGAAQIAKSLVVGLFTLSLLMFLAALLGLFYAWPILILSTASAYLIGKRLVEKEKRTRIRRSIWIILAAMLVFTLVVQQVSPVTIESDAYGRYLPWAERLASHHDMPAVLESGDFGPFMLIFSPHLLHTSLGLLFSLFGSTSDYLVAAVPVFYSLAALLFAMVWAEEKLKGSADWVSAMLVSSYAYLLVFHSILQEGPLMLFVTLSVYFISEYVERKSDTTLVFAALSLSLASQTKYNGLIFSAVGFIALITANPKRYLKIIGIFLLAHLPVAVLMVRNYLAYGNPVYRLLSAYFPGKWNYFLTLKPIRPTDNSVSAVRFLRNMLIEFPAIILTLAYMIRKWREPIVRISVAFSLLMVLLLPLFGLRLLTRYMTPFFMVLAIMSAITLYEIVTIKPIASFTKKISAAAAVIILLLGMVAVLEVMKTSPSIQSKHIEYDSQRTAVQFILEDYGKGAVLWGEGSQALEWYADAHIVTPDYNMYLLAVNKSPIVYTDDFTREDLRQQIMNRGIVTVSTDFDAEDYNMIAHQIGAEYIYDSVFNASQPGFQETNAILMQPIFDAAESNAELFTLIFEDRYGARIWHVN